MLAYSVLSRDLKVGPALPKPQLDVASLRNDTSCQCVMGFVHGRYAELALEAFIMVEGQLNLFASISHYSLLCSHMCNQVYQLLQAVMKIPQCPLKKWSPMLRQTARRHTTP